ncbi:hypothetical protein MKK84_24375 [Methylobacterium sp. E-065]|uniref:hypothetical protein n=1 Tax=Methylobacterium sp. E-065 TaxID=2836583 RepID=UPI001FBAC2B4|nr:hypothetical protein [Methylobacterium sp. E-065]MCJ2020527.1 hypothetical protein [Methylobacterium sp. E-065]
MKIATNTPASFSVHAGLEFVDLGDDVEDTSIIILMLEKNWGGGSIGSIKALTYWISGYPKQTPCYIIGCESRIPDANLQNYPMPERDDAIRALCDEVLKRSRSIGVRGEITYLHLTKLLGYSGDSVDIIFEASKDNNTESFRSFLSKNNCPLQQLEQDILNFQVAPSALYERLPPYDKDIVIGFPYITTSDQNVRLNADIIIDGRAQTLWCETNSIYRQFLLHERADAFLSVLLPFAMRSRKNVICKAPISEQFLHNLNEILIPQLCTHDSRLHQTQISANSDPAILFCGNAVATGMSCGVDSFYTVCLYKDSEYKSLKLTHLYTGNYLYGNAGPIYERAQSAAQDLGLSLICTGTNINEALDLPHLYTHFFKTLFGVLALRKLFRIYFYSTARDFGQFSLNQNSTNDTAKIELLLLQSFSCSDFQVITGGVKSERIEKTRAVCELEVAQKFLNVCLYPARETNCGKCAKCKRTLVTIDMMGKLDNFKAVFDIEQYLNNRLENFVYLTQQKDDVMLSEVYKHFCRTEPEIMREAQEITSIESD